MTRSRIISAGRRASSDASQRRAVKPSAKLCMSYPALRRAISRMRRTQTESSMIRINGVMFFFSLSNSTDYQCTGSVTNCTGEIARNQQKNCQEYVYSSAEIAATRAENAGMSANFAQDRAIFEQILRVCGL